MTPNRPLRLACAALSAAAACTLPFVLPGMLAPEGADTPGNTAVTEAPVAPESAPPAEAGAGPAQVEAPAPQEPPATVDDAEPPAPAEEAEAGSDEPTFAERFLSILNEQRRAQGLRPLRASDDLARAARGHARDMVENGFFSHSSPDGDDPRERIAAHYEAVAWGETILWRSPTVSPEEALQMWMDSPPHRSLLLSPAFRELGLAKASAERAGGTYGDRPVAVVVADLGAR